MKKKLIISTLTLLSALSAFSIPPVNEIHPAYATIAITNYRFFAAYLSLVILLAVVLFVLVRVKEIQREVNEKRHRTII
jgi:uncharacterized protein HemY